MTRCFLTGALAAAFLAGCSSCPAPTQSASAKSSTVALDAATPTASFILAASTLEQTCDCKFCEGGATMTLSLSASVKASSEARTGDIGVLRIALSPLSYAYAQTLEPALPVDVVIDADPPASVPFQVNRDCDPSDPCDIDYQISAAWLDPKPTGEIEVSFDAGVRYPTKRGGELKVKLTP